MSLYKNIQKLAAEQPELRRHLVPLLRRQADDSLQRIIRVFQKQHPYYNDLDLIASQRRTLIGDGRFEVTNRNAKLLARLSYVYIVEGLFGPELDLTTKGERRHRADKEDFEML